MVEMLLGLAVSGAFLLMMVRMQAEATSDNQAKNVAESMQSFSQVASQFLAGNRAAIQAAADAGTNAALWCKIGADPTAGTGGVTSNDTTAKTCAVDAAWLKYKRLLPMTYNETNAWGQKWIAVYRVIYADYDNNAGTPNTTIGDMEMLVVATGGSGQTAKSLGVVAELAGGNGGYVPSADWGACQYTSTSRQACGTGGGWRADLTQYNIGF